MAAAIKNLNKAVTKLVDEVQVSTLDKVLEFVKTYVKDEAAFVAAFDEFKKTLKTDTGVLFSPIESKRGSNGGERKKRTPSEYNIFIGSKIKELKLVNADKNGKELMKMAIESWKARVQVAA